MTKRNYCYELSEHRQYKALEGVKVEREPKNIKNPKCAEFIPQKKK